MNLSKLKKPHFFKNKIATISGIIGTIISIVLIAIPNIFDIKVLNISLNWYILILLLLLFLAILTINYICDVKNFYNEYENQFREINTLKTNNDALTKNLEKRKNEIENLNRKILEYDFIINNIISRVQQGACNITSEEHKYLLNLYNILLNDRNKLLQNILKGDYNE